MSFIPPCRREGADPEDWFIGGDGKQYRDDDLLTVAEVEAIIVDLPDEAEADEVDEAIAAAEEERKAENLRKRRHAIETCFNECIARVRLHCLEAGMDEHHGIWGGYTEKQRRKISLARLARGVRATAPNEE